jgi:hypothetical protein
MNITPEHEALAYTILMHDADHPDGSTDDLAAAIHSAGFRRPTPPTDEQIDAALEELIARINNVIQPTRGTMRAVLEAAARVGGAGND